MKKRMLFFLVIALAIGLSSCSQSSKSQGAKEVTTESPENKEGQARDIDVVARANDQFNKMGITLDETQQAKLQEIAGKYDFAGVTSKEERRAMRQDFQKDIYNNVLTPEQQAALDGMRESRGNKDGN